MKVYMIRHGQTDWNVQKRVQGKTDIELNDTGIAQAEEAREKINNIKIDLILCSPLKRAKKTAEIINRDKNIPIIYDENFKERDFGDFEGRVILKGEIFTSETFFNTNINYSENNVEPINSLIERIKNRLEEIKEIYKDKNLLIVTHGGVLRVVNACVNGIPENGIVESANVKNCDIVEYEI